MSDSSGRFKKCDQDNPNKRQQQITNEYGFTSQRILILKHNIFDKRDCVIQEENNHLKHSVSTSTCTTYFNTQIFEFRCFADSASQYSYLSNQPI